MTRLIVISYPQPQSLSLSLPLPLSNPPTVPDPPASSLAFTPFLPLLLIADLYADCDLGGYKGPHIILDHSSAPMKPVMRKEPLMML